MVNCTVQYSCEHIKIFSNLLSFFFLLIGTALCDYMYQSKDHLTEKIMSHKKTCKILNRACIYFQLWFQTYLYHAHSKTFIYTTFLSVYHLLSEKSVNPWQFRSLTCYSRESLVCKVIALFVITSFINTIHLANECGIQ